MVYFLSDAHIGSRAFSTPQEQEQKMVDLLRKFEHDATAIYLLGDIFDFWFEFFWWQRKQFPLLLQTLRELTNKGIDVHFFAGNHDMWSFGYLAKQTGIIWHPATAQKVIHGKRCFLAHGDGIVPSDYLQRFSKEKQKRILAFIRLQKIFHNRFVQYLYRSLPPFIGNAIGYAWAKQSRLKELYKPTDFLGENNESLVLFSKEMEQKEHFDYYIFGHRHIDLDLQITPNSRVIILGDLFKINSYAQMNEQGKVELQYL